MKVGKRLNHGRFDCGRVALLVRVGSGVELLQYDLWVLLQQLVVDVPLHERLVRLAIHQVDDVVEAGAERFGIDVDDLVVEGGEAVLGKERLLLDGGRGHNDSNLLEGGRLSPRVFSSKSTLILYQIFTKKSIRAIILTDEKVPSNHLISRDVYGCV